MSKIVISNLPIENQRAINDILYVHFSDRFPNIKATTLRTIDLLFRLGYYDDSESLFLEEKENFK